MGSAAKKQRLDVLLVELGLAPSRQKSQALILSGNVLVRDQPIDKPGTSVAVDAPIRIRGEQSHFVGRGGDKINPAFDHYQLEMKGVVALDVGASTGGFTDCMLQRGASLVYAVDVGYNQLVHKLRIDPRVKVMERTHAKDLPGIAFDPVPNFSTIDVSFIGLRKILEPVCAVLARPCKILALVKPQFELGPEYVAEGGVVKSEKDQLLAVSLVREYAKELGLYGYKEFPCPLKGEKKGNQEYFILLSDEPISAI